MENAGVIIRVSTTRQLDGTSPEKQLERILALASQQKYQVIPKHIWQIAESGSLRERAGFEAAIDAGDRKEISRLYVFNIDRLGRDLLAMLLFLRSLDDLGIECWAAEKEERLLGDDFIFQIEGAVAAKERKEIIKRTQDGLLRAIRAGKYSGGMVAYGYRMNLETKELEIDETEAKVVRNIFIWSAEEKISCIKIAERLNALGVPTHYVKDGRKIHRKGKREAEKTAGIWRPGRVRNMIVNTAYMGEWEYGKRSKKRKTGETIHSTCPAIVTKEQFQIAQNVLKNNRLFKDSKPYRTYLLRGLIACGNCGLTYSGTYSRVSPDKSIERLYYACNGRTQWRRLGREKCFGATLVASEIEAVVWDEIKIYCKHPEIAIDQLRSARSPEIDNLAVRFDEINKQITELKRKEKNLIFIAAESTEVDPGTLDKLLVENKKQQQELVDYRDKLNNVEQDNDWIEAELSTLGSKLSALGQRIENASNEEKRAAILELVKSIVVETDHTQKNPKPVVTITFRFSKLPESLPAESFAMAENYTLRGSLPL